ncbi:pesticin C-terminus-like muramidase [Vibrio brasiliensis]|uniref:pesticin C-terminus-like muramidase n=1 Tax=Vibrio brasiliensis TaxID=170652 RepID=UPI001EFD325D|nr:pesticin C-terminus-like muramidase [Vibrio brasiliensis]MCG9725930.1 pesticin C-terminus-like muramidase [Vibrio brasiliensis]
MSAQVGGRGLIHKGDSTTTGGVVTQGLGNVMLVGEGATQIEMIATCPICEKGWGKIVPIEKWDVFIDNVQAALDGDLVMCGCPEGSNTLIASADAMRFSKVDGQIHGFKPHASTQEMDATYQSVASSIGGTYSTTSTSTSKGVAKDLDEMDKKWLIVPKGQLTFQLEGNDIEGSVYFTRIPHVPNNNGIAIGKSGITFGRGLDIGSRSAADVSEIFSEVEKHCKSISSKMLEWLKGGAELKGQDAYEYYKTLNQKVPKSEQELTRKQQHFLFLEIYPFYEKETERLLTKTDVRNAYDKEHVIAWQLLPINVKDVLVDVTYRGDNRPASRGMIVPALVMDIKNGLTKESSNLYKVMKDKIWMSSYHVDLNRYEARYKELIK